MMFDDSALARVEDDERANEGRSGIVRLLGFDQCLFRSSARGSGRKSKRSIAAPTIADLAARFEEEHLPKIGRATGADYGAMIKTYVLPTL